MLEGALGVLHLVVAVWAILNIMKSRETTGAKALWVLLVVLLPIIGLIVWLIAGPKSKL